MANTTTSKTKTVKPSEFKLTPKQKKFVKHYIETGNGTKSAKLAGYSEVSAATQAYENLRKPHILAKLEASTEQAEGVILSLMHSGETGDLKLKAAREVLDRTIGKPVQRSESVSVNITVESMLGTGDSKAA